MTPRAKKRLRDALRIAVCVAALWIVAQGVTLNDHIILRKGNVNLSGSLLEKGDSFSILLADGTTRLVPMDEIALDAQGNPRVSYGLRTAWRNSSKTFLLLATAIYFPVVFLQAVRLRWLLLAQSIGISLWECIKFSFAGNFLNFATPLGSNAGDVFKAYFASLHTTSKTEAMTTIALDRIIGLGTLISVVAIITALSPSTSRLALFRPYVLIVVASGVVAFFAYISPALRARLLPRRWLERLPMFEQLQRIDNATRTLIKRRGTVASAVLVTVVLQAMAIGAYFVVAVALALKADASNVLEYFAYFYTGTVVQALPGPPQGLGTVELTYRYFLAPFGNPSQILCCAFAIRIMVLVCSLPGAVVALTGSYKPSASGSNPQTDPGSQSSTSSNGPETRAVLIQQD